MMPADQDQRWLLVLIFDLTTRWMAMMILVAFLKFPQLQTMNENNDQLNRDPNMAVPPAPRLPAVVKVPKIIPSGDLNNQSSYFFNLKLLIDYLFAPIII